MVLINSKYEILQLLGEGTFGKIYEGINTLTNELIAIKIQKTLFVNILKNEANMLTISIANTLQNYNTVISGNLSNIGQYDSMILQGTRSDGTLVNYQATGVIRNTRFEFDLGASGAGTVDMTFTCATFV